MASRKGKGLAAASQVWFFLNETMASSSFTQKVLSLQEVKTYSMSLKTCLDLSGGVGNVKDYAFYIHSESMASAVRMLSDESIIATYNLYCPKDSVVTIIVRRASDPSPNTSCTPSHNNSLASRKSASKSRGVIAPELFIHPRVRHASGSIDMTTLEKIDDEENMVSIAVDDQVMTFTADYLLGWIESQLLDLKHPTRITVCSIAPDGSQQSVLLSASIWQRHLLRGSGKEPFTRIWEAFTIAEAQREEILSDITSRDDSFHKNCHDFIYDLRNYGNNKSSRSRLESNGHQFYIGEPYFRTAIRDKLLQLPTFRGNLETSLKSLEAKRADSTICASHDLSPIFEAALGVS
ncbi:hypothetical protein CCM_08694 [Cordyceps militaris CM01]|uniref:Uncharacterized protein n=1 Tax=Cordyceps militaris (strain CM01) TaxID=983644 RepID=G3JS03_CORMM|nr:uncharacterized protein CCM_08694 [Cordyceps militaris CM01]EGX88649.1 hypothetical protein CCM_08694 [Cordyceps militaris CM01]